MQEERHYYLKQLGIDVWEERVLPEVDKLTSLKNEVASCTLCSLHKTRTQTVFARGNSKAKLMIVGEAPGFYEDKQGLPFVGKAGGLLDLMLKAIGLDESEFYIANVLKCRPPDNRDPSCEEISLCGNYLMQQIKEIQPKVILALGRFAGNFLAKQALQLNRLRQSLVYYEQIPCVVTYHPAYLLRNPVDKKKTFSDLLKIKELLSKSNES